MSFDIQNFFLNQFVLMFLILALGNLFGKIKFGKFSFGISGALFIGLVVGFFITKLAAAIPESSGLYARAQKVVSGNIIDAGIRNLSLMIFIVGTGLLAAKDMKYALKKYGKQFTILAIVIPLAGMVFSYGASRLMSSMNPYQITGTYTGSLTSSAGLGASVQSANAEAVRSGQAFKDQSPKKQQLILNMINTAMEREAKLKDLPAPEKKTLENTQSLTEEEIQIYASEAEAGVGVGYSLGYPFGVLAIILAVNFLPLIFKIDVEEEKRKYFEQKSIDTAGDEDDGIQEVNFDFVGFSLTAFLGYALGMLKINLGPLGYFSLGNVGGGIIVALLLGAKGELGPIKFRMNSMLLGNLRTYFLSLFLAATGVNYGFRVVEALTGSGLSVVIVANIVAYGAILVGFFLGHYVFKINWSLLGGALTGGMTSAPGLGAAIDALGCDEPATSYGATQPIATLFMVILSLIIYQLPI
ncbi:MAG: hypothetical protein Q4E36_00965 [Bacillota bacterium]|nr:hypothetical protein [Bacillota bacterium]